MFKQLATIPLSLSVLLVMLSILLYAGSWLLHHMCNENLLYPCLLNYVFSTVKAPLACKRAIYNPLLLYKRLSVLPLPCYFSRIPELSKSVDQAQSCLSHCFY